MNTKRNNEIKAVVAALTVAAAIVSGLLTVRGADAAPQVAGKNRVSRSHHRKPVVVKIAGSRRAAESRAESLYSGAVAKKDAARAAAVAASAAMRNRTNNDPSTVQNGNDRNIPLPVNTNVIGFGPNTNIQTGYGTSYSGYGQSLIYPGVGNLNTTIVGGYPNSPAGFSTTTGPLIYNNGVFSINDGFSFGF